MKRLFVIPKDSEMSDCQHIVFRTDSTVHYSQCPMIPIVSCSSRFGSDIDAKDAAARYEQK